MIYQLFGQLYTATNYTFLRLGAGVGETRILDAPQQVLFGLERRNYVRPGWSIGAGVDIPIVWPVYFTAMLDYVALANAKEEDGELATGLALGIGITIR